jgi:hypothetical protein
MLCDNCHNVFNRELVEIRVHNNNRTQHWVVREPSSHIGDCVEKPTTYTTWEWLKERLERPSYSSYTIHAKPLPPSLKIMTHHTLKDLISSARNGCPSCGLLVQQPIEFITGTKDIDVHNVRSVPIIVGRDMLTQNPHGPARKSIPLQLRLWFVGDDDTIYCHWPDSHGKVLRVDILGPFPSRATEQMGNFQKSTLSMLSKWLVDCEQHQRCATRSNAHRRIFPGMPSRLLQILGDGIEIEVRLMEYDSIKLANGKIEYTTLSHCWGKGPTKQLSEHQYDRLASGIPSRALPPTFRDAVEVSAAVGFRFIWIGALCIMQDSERNWHREASQMSSVHANASMNIAASAAKDSDQGLFFREHDTVIAINWPRSAVNGDWYSLRPGSKVDPESYNYGSIEPRLPLDERAWVFQERLLSSRLIAFEGGQIRWQCLEHIATDINIENDSRVYKSSDLALERGNWATLVQEFMARRLTFQNERLLALSALAHAFCRLHSRQNSDYLAGLWRQELREHLLWRLKFPVKPSPETHGGEYCAPSWSWASLPNLDHKCFEFKNRRWSTERRVTGRLPEWGSDLWGSPDAEEGPIWQKTFSVLDALIEPTGEDCFGALRSAHLLVECLTYPIKLESTLRRENDMICSVQNQDGLHGAYHADYLETSPPPEGAFFVPLVVYLAVSVGHRDGIFIDGLLLIPSSEAGTFKRIGILEIQSLKQIPLWWSINPGVVESESSGYQSTYLKQIRIV